MFKSKERIERLESKVVKLEKYCTVLENEQEMMYDAILKGLKLELTETNTMLSAFNVAKENRRKAFETLLHE